MRVAMFSPLPPSKSGIADYAETLLEHLRPLADVTAFGGTEPRFDASSVDALVYQVGNNPYHEFVYEMALRHPGVVVMHEANLHHLIADLTIRRGDWDAYVAEVEFCGGPEALEHARRVRALEVGPDYEGLPMTRRLLGSARALIVHSQFMVDAMRSQGFEGPIARIPHGAWIPRVDRGAYRDKLGLDETTPLIGIFGFLKPYKRIAESLRAMRRLARLQPDARMILVGEPHPDLGVHGLIRTLGLDAEVRVAGFTPLEEFVGYIGACDIVLNLRYPTVGETSGSLLRALGLGKAVLVSDVGAFRELPDEICLKVPVDGSEEDLIFEYLNMLVARPSLAAEMGARAKRWVERECNWDLVARQYLSFLEAVNAQEEWRPAEPRRESKAAEQKALAREGEAATEPPASPEYFRSWVEESDSRAYLEQHLTRLEKTLSIIPPGGPEDRILEMGAYLQLTPALKFKLGYGEVRGCYYGAPGKVDHREAVSTEGERFACEIDLFDAEKDRFPYPDDWFQTVLCCELIEHLYEDPMHMMWEVNRVLKPGGHFVLTTPNVVSLRAITAILQGYHPGFFHAYVRNSGEGKTDARHNREYAPWEVHQLLEDSGFEVTLLDSGPFREKPEPEHAWVLHMLKRYRLAMNLRGDGIYAVGRKTGPVRERYPSWLYSGTGE